MYKTFKCMPSTHNLNRTFITFLSSNGNIGVIISDHQLSSDMGVVLDRKQYGAASSGLSA